MYEALVAKDDTALATALTGGQTLQTFTKPKKAEAVKGGEYDVDHVIPLAKHWYDTGWNSGDGERIGATDSDANLQLLTERENSVKGSKYAGKVYHFNERPYVGPNFTSDIADAKTIDGEQFHTEDQR